MPDLLLVTYHFPPSAASGAFRMLGFARHLPKFGWRTVVVAPPSMPTEPVDGGLRNSVPADTPIHHAAYPQGWASRPLRRLAPRAVWLPPAWFACVGAIKEHKPRAVLTSGPPHVVHLLGLLVKRRYGLPWLADFRDPWVAGSREAGDPPWRDWWARPMEPAVMREADTLIVNAPRAREVLQRAYPEHADKIAVVTNGFDPEDFAVLEPHAGPHDALRIVHTGELYASRDPRPVLDAVQELAADATRPVQLRIVGRAGDLPFDLPTEVRKRGLEANVVVTGQVPHAESLRELRAADILLILDTPGRTAGVPAKLYEYLGAGRPILALAEQNSDVARILAESGAAHCVADPRDVLAVKQALLHLCRLGSNPGEAPDLETSLSRFTRARLAQRLVQLAEDVVAPRDGPYPRRERGHTMNCIASEKPHS